MTIVVTGGESAAFLNIKRKKERNDMETYKASNFEELLKLRREDFPQAIVAGWLSIDGEPIAACAQVCDAVPTEGELLAAYAACLKAVLMKFEQMMEGRSDEDNAIVYRVIDAMCSDLVVYRKMESGLVSKKALSASA